MKVFRDINQLPAFDKPVITIGSFDGLHKGHQRVLQQVKNQAARIGGESVIVTFEPHPRQVIYPQASDLKLITSLEEKILLMELYEVENLVIVPFTVEFSQISADEYIEKFIIERFRPACIVIGFDHRFGLNRQGDIHFLRWYSKTGGYTVSEIDEFIVNDITVSSSKIRRALDSADMVSATELLNHPFILQGTVVYGNQIGGKLGYPTANLEYSNRLKLIPPDGIYAVLVHHGEQVYKGALYIGKKPTLSSDDKRVIEVHLLDFRGELYGEKLLLEFIDYIRPDARFEHLEQMKKQISLDKEAVRDRLTGVRSAFDRKREAIL